MISERNKPIGIFDSGLGGLTGVKAIREVLPFEDIVYLGDTARVPYGDRSKDTILEYAEQDIRFLLSKGVKAVVIACNTADSMARLEMERIFDIPIVGVVKPAGEKAAAATKNNIIGVLGTNATKNSGAYEKVITECNKNAKVRTIACPLLVPLVEEGRISPHDNVTRSVLSGYLNELDDETDTIVLGCTHYPLLRGVFQKIVPQITLIDSGSAAGESLKKMLTELDLLHDETGGEQRFYVTDDAESFASQGSLFLGKQIDGKIKKVIL